MEAVKLCLLTVLFAVVKGQLQVGFDQLDYAIVEGNRQRTATVLKEGENIGDITFRITPLTFDQFFSEGNELPDAVQDLDIPDPAEFDSERQDFSNVIQTVTFPPSSTEELRTVNITVFDDAINEATEGYLLMVEVIMSDPQDTANLELGNGGISLVVVTDDDAIALGFEQTQYTVREDVGSLSGVSVIKENGVITEQNLTVLLQSADATAMEGLDYDGTAGGSFVLTFLPTEQSVPVVGISIINDIIPESVEQFQLQLSRPTEAPYDLGATPAFIFIQDDDVAVVGFEQAKYSVEADGEVEVCVVLDSGEFIPGSILLSVLSVNTSDEDFVPIRFAVLVLPSPDESPLRECVASFGPIQPFELQLVPFSSLTIPPNVIIRPNTTTVCMIDDDALCLDPPTIMNGMRTFTGNSVGDTATYSCNSGFELIGNATTTCTAAADGNSASFPSVPPPECRPLCLDPPTIMNGMRIFTGNSVGDTATYSCNLGFELIGVATTTCTAAADGNSASFPSVPPPECRPMLPNDTLTNDTLIGDPLYAVPFTEDGVSLCFEVHGAASQYFNLVSDTCTSVNAFYAPLPLLNDSRNFVEEIGVRAVGSSGACYNIRVYESDSEGLCVATVDNTTVGPSGIEVDGIRVRRIMDRVRISVPNCENINLVMWVTCEERNGLRMLRFDISRGLTLRPTSHGLIGQFWNIPITYDPNRFGGMLASEYDTNDVRIVTVSPVDSSPPRQFLAERQSQTWAKSRNTCFYAGDGQGGPSEAGQPDDSVIQGDYSEYRVGGLFEHEFRYAKFENNRCL